MTAHTIPTSRDEGFVEKGKSSVATNLSPATIAIASDHGVKAKTVP